MRTWFSARKDTRDLLRATRELNANLLPHSFGLDKRFDTHTIASLRMDELDYL